MYIAMDMGTSNTRLWLIENNNIKNFIKIGIGAGITKSKGKDFLFNSIRNEIALLLKESEVFQKDIECILVCGMAGSELGLVDIPRFPVPMNINALSKQLSEHRLDQITSIPFFFVPGLKKCKNELLLDIIRGEETEALGILSSAPFDDDIILLLPGTHNKVISVLKDGTITDFYTTMSGEVLNNIISSSILTGSVSHIFKPNKTLIKKGAEFSAKNGINEALFQVRVMSLNGTNTNDLSSFLYGSVLGQDIQKIIKLSKNKPIYIGGNEMLKNVYNILLEPYGKPICSEISASATQLGLCKIHESIKL